MEASETPPATVKNRVVDWRLPADWVYEDDGIVINHVIRVMRAQADDVFAWKNLGTVMEQCAMRAYSFCFKKGYKRVSMDFTLYCVMRLIWTRHLKFTPEQWNENEFGGISTLDGRPGIVVDDGYTEWLEKNEPEFFNKNKNAILGKKPVSTRVPVRVPAPTRALAPAPTPAVTPARTPAPAPALLPMKKDTPASAQPPPAKAAVSVAQHVSKPHIPEEEAALKSSETRARWYRNLRKLCTKSDSPDYSKLGPEHEKFEVLLPRGIDHERCYRSVISQAHSLLIPGLRVVWFQRGEDVFLVPHMEADYSHALIRCYIELWNNLSYYARYLTTAEHPMSLFAFLNKEQHDLVAIMFNASGDNCMAVRAAMLSRAPPKKDPEVERRELVQKRTIAELEPTQSDEPITKKAKNHH
ncbi:hypothetical protein CkaCkLH20_06230 [Colletotrichum karsti]|uniref:Uncharacterized protein n=1 Tax=Colletotrichum karsti TaxID=1095194 RepID=A0A9P6LL80_9PEZI|nr:uncharacterized protein CkaCkLH20_06230 [Colletotrichum karsti]KAF9876287.1 hypothetical protein CkaCkLH20_06230 [Colletotrichum karsti]